MNSNRMNGNKCFNISGLARFRNMLCLAQLALTIGLSPIALAAPSSHSFIDYRPLAEEYQANLRPLVKSILKTLTKLKTMDDNAKNLELKKAVSYAKSHFEKVPRGYHDEIWFLIGLLQESGNSPAKALESFSSSISLSSRTPNVLFRQGLILKRLQRCDEAISVFKEVIWRTNKSKHEVFQLTAECFLSLGRREEALTSAISAYMSKPDYLPSLRFLVKERNKKLLEASPEERRKIESYLLLDLSTITTLDPMDREAALVLGRLLLKRSDPLIHQEQLLRVGSIAKRFCEFSGYKDEESVKLLFDAQIKRGNLAGARETLDKGLKAKPNSEVFVKAMKQLEMHETLE